MTLNQTIARLNLLATSHKQIKQFEFDNLLDWFDGSDLQYPACLVDLNTASISTADHTTSFPFEIWFADMTNVNADAKSNETDVMSDLTSIAEDYLALIQDPAFEDDWTIEGVSPLTYYKEYFTDWVFAVKMTVTISTNYLSNRCQVPLVGVDPNILKTDGGIFLRVGEGFYLKLNDDWTTPVLDKNLLNTDGSFSLKIESNEYLKFE